MDINDAVDYIINSHKIKYTNLIDAKTTIIINGKYEYCYDALSLGIYNHNLPFELFQILKETLSLKFRNTKEEEKERRERLFLLYYSRYVNSLVSFNIEKHEHPDFILIQKDLKIGIEITEFCLASIKIISDISKESKIQKLTLVETKRYGLKEHGKKSKKFDYFSLNGVHAISTPIYDVNKQKIEYAKLIDKKLKKYEELAPKFFEMIIFCVHFGIDICCDEDAQEVFSYVSYDPKNIITVIICYENNGNYYYSKKTF